jgi:hypothetical protein
LAAWAKYPEAAGTHLPQARARLGRWLPDALAAVGLLALGAVVYNIPSILEPPYWLDEAWVALSRRLPLSDLPAVTATTPILWSFLLRLVPGDNLRLVPLAFLFTLPVLAYGLVRLAGWRSKMGGVLVGVAAGAAVLLLPAQQVRHDLKQYTADAAAALLILLVVVWVEGGWSRRRLATLVAVLGAGMLISTITAVVGACALAGLTLAALSRRHWRQLIEVVVLGLVSGGLILVVYFTIAARGVSEQVTHFWSGYFPRTRHMEQYLLRRLDGLEPYLGMPWPLLLLLAGAGVLTLAAARRPAAATAIALLPLAMVTLGVMRIYPLLDLRTSHFLLVVATATAAIGVGGLAMTIGTRIASRPGGRRAGAAATAAIVLIALGGYALTNRTWLRYDGHSGPHRIVLSMYREDVRTPTRCVASQRGPGDVVLVSVGAGYGFAYYWTPDPPGWTRAPAGPGWVPTYPRSTGILILRDRTPDAIRRGLAEAEQLVRERGGQGMVWLIRDHVGGRWGERRVWNRELLAYPYRASDCGDRVLVMLPGNL